MMEGVIAWREQIRDNAITPVVILWKHPCAQPERSEKRKKNEHQQRGQD